MGTPEELSQPDCVLDRLYEDLDEVLNDTLYDAHTALAGGLEHMAHMIEGQWSDTTNPMHFGPYEFLAQVRDELAAHLDPEWPAKKAAREKRRIERAKRLKAAGGAGAAVSAARLEPTTAEEG